MFSCLMVGVERLRPLWMVLLLDRWPWIVEESRLSKHGEEAYELWTFMTAASVPALGSCPNFPSGRVTQKVSQTNPSLPKLVFGQCLITAAEWDTKYTVGLCGYPRLSGED